MNKQLSILITEKAKSDIIKISDYIAQDNKSAAIKMVDIFYKSFEVLSLYPETGSVKKDLKDKTIRIFSIKKNFSVVYRIKQNKIEILRILTRYQNIIAILN